MATGREICLFGQNKKTPLGDKRLQLNRDVWPMNTSILNKWTSVQGYTHKCAHANTGHTVYRCNTSSIKNYTDPIIIYFVFVQVSDLQDYNKERLEKTNLDEGNNKASQFIVFILQHFLSSSQHARVPAVSMSGFHVERVMLSDIKADYKQRHDRYAASGDGTYSAGPACSLEPPGKTN